MNKRQRKKAAKKLLLKNKHYGRGLTCILLDSMLFMEKSQKIAKKIAEKYFGEDFFDSGSERLIVFPRSHAPRLQTREEILKEFLDAYKSKKQKGLR